jgi:hypothetical protein
VATYNSFNDLQTAVFRWLNREDDPDAMDRAAEFIGLAEARIRREQDWFTQIYSLENGGNPFPVSTNPTELPTYVRTLKNMWCATGISHDEIEIVPISAWRDLVSSNNDASGVPQKAVLSPQMDKWMKDDGTRQGPMLYLWPQPAADSSGNPFLIDFQYIRDVAPLSEDAQNNGLLLRYPDLYLYGALAESAPYYQHDERLQIWDARYQDAVKKINIERERAEFGASAKRVRLPRSF